MQRRPDHILTALLLALLGAGCAATPVDDTREPVDLVVNAGLLLTMADGAGIARDQALAIRAGRIVAIGSQDKIADSYRAETIVDTGNDVVMPGLVNGHTHAAMSLLRGVADDLELMTWLNKYIFPAEVELVDDDFVRVGTALACYEMIRGGTTSFVDMYYFPDAVAETVVDCGLRAVVVPSVIEQVSPDAATGAESLAGAVDFVRRWQDRHPRIVPAVGAHSVYTISEPALRRIRDAAVGLDAPLAIHVAESRFEMQTTADTYGRTPVALLRDLGFFDVPLIAAHVVYADADDAAILADHGVGVVHNPTSNMKLASGVAPVSALRAAGVTVGLGTDGAASNNDLDMWEEIRLAALLAKVSENDSTALPAATVLRMATIEGARAAGLGDEVGSLEPGKRADLISVTLSDLALAPVYDVISHLVYVADEQDVRTTIVEGRVLMQDGQVRSIDDERLTAEVARWRARIKARLLPDQADFRNDSP